MKLPSGVEIPREKVEELCEVVIREKFQLECTTYEAFESTREDLLEGSLDDIPVLEEEDVKFLYEAIRHLVFDCVEALTETLAAYFVAHVKPLDW